VDGGVKKKRKKKDKKKDKSSKSKRKDKDGDARIENAIEKAAGGGAGGGAPNSKWKHGDWSCQKCGAHNFRGKDSCFRCKYARANSVKAASAESALAYLTARRAGATEMDSVQHLWLGKSAYNRDVNDATFDLYVDTYVGTLEDKHKLQILKRARLAAARAARLVEALKDTPEESREGDGKAPSSGKKRKKKRAKKPENGGARAATETAEKAKGEEKKKPSEPLLSGEAKAKGKEGKKEGKTKKAAPSAVATKEAKAAEAKASSPKKETAAKRKASSAAEAPPARVTRSRAAKK
jgi:hypothetical protein